MADSFDKDYWEQHWQQANTAGPIRAVPANPCLETEIEGLEPGSALDAGCGQGAEAIWLAVAGWQVTAVDISAAALAGATERASHWPDAAARLRWVEADLSAWEPDKTFDLVVTHYAHPAIPQLKFYSRISDWVAPGGTLLIVGHLHHDHHERGGHDQGHHRDADQPPAEVTVTADAVAALFEPAGWEIVTTAEVSRTVTRGAGQSVAIDDVVVRARRRPNGFEA